MASMQRHSTWHYSLHMNSKYTLSVYYGVVDTSRYVAVVYRLNQSHVYYPRPSSKNHTTATSNARQRKTYYGHFGINFSNPAFEFDTLRTDGRQIVITDA